MNLLRRLLWTSLGAAVALTAISAFGQQSSPPQSQDQQQKQEQGQPSQGQPPQKQEEGQPPQQGKQEGGPQQEQPQAPKMDVSRLFATTCGWCHEGGGRKQGRGPKLAGTDKSDQFLINRIKTGKPPGMPAFGRAFNDDQIQAIVAYIRSLPE